jgi:hypothetical protein
MRLTEPIPGYLQTTATIQRSIGPIAFAGSYTWGLDLVHSKTGFCLALLHLEGKLGHEHSAYPFLHNVRHPTERRRKSSGSLMCSDTPLS